MTSSSTRGSTEPLAPRPVLIMTLAFWGFVFTVYTIRSFVFTEVPFWDQFFPRFINCSMGAMFCLGVYLVLRSQIQRQPWFLLVLGFVCSLVGGILYATLSPITFMAFVPESAKTYEMPEGAVVSTLLTAQTYLWVFLSWCFGFLALAYNERSRLNELRLLEAQALAADAQNRMLRYQINPHFLFNTLNTLSSFVLERKVEKAEETLLSLSEFLRYSLARSPDEMVPLREEVSAQEDYLNIERARFGDRVEFVVEIPAETADTPVPSLILQPIVENSVKYAVSATNQPVTIELLARREDHQVVIVIRDNGPGRPAGKSGLGVGLENVRRRLDLAYGGRASFRHGPRESAGYAAVLTLPAGGLDEAG